MKRAILTTLIVVAGFAQGGEPGHKLHLHSVPVPVNSYRLLAMSMDEDGFIWAGSVHKVVHRYDPRTGQVENLDVPYQATASACICVGKKVYILGQTYPKLIIFDRTNKKFSEVAYSSVKPNVWYGTEAIDGRHIFLFDRGVQDPLRSRLHQEGRGSPHHRQETQVAEMLNAPYLCRPSHRK